MAICIALGFTLAGNSVSAGSPLPTSITPDLPGLSNVKPAPGMFLVARRTLGDSHFGQTVIYLVEHDEHGTLGVIVNRSSKISLSDVLPDLDGGDESAYVLHYGGPVGLPMLLMLGRGESGVKGMAHVAEDVYFSSERSVLEEALAGNKPVNQLRFYIGYSGWGAGQLEFELERDSWYVVAADSSAIFSSEADSLWGRLVERREPMGIQVDNRGFLPALTTGS